LHKITPPQFIKPDGLNAIADDENADTLKLKITFKQSLTGDVTTDETVIDDIEELNID
jgi:hypothetical protein